MGAPMARHLATAGLLECVWNRTAAKADELAAELGVDAAESPAQLASRCNVVLTCVAADDDLLEVVRQSLPGVTAGTVFVDTSTVSPGSARRVAEQVDAAGGSLVDAPVSGGVEGARKGTLSVMAGGKSADLSRIRPVLDAISRSVTHMGGVGAGQATKAVNQVIVGGVAEAVCEALALAEKLNLPSERLLGVLGAGAAGSWFLEHRGQSMLEDRFTPGFKSALLLKDLRICQALARELNINLSVVKETIRDYERLVEAGEGDSDTSALIRIKREPREQEG